MINKLIENIYPDFSHDRKSQLVSFLCEQSIDVDEISTALMLAYKIYEHNPDVEFMYDKSIKSIRMSTRCQYTLEQKHELSVVGVDVKDQTKSSLLNEVVNGLKKEIPTKGKIHISTDKNFLNIYYFEDNNNPNILNMELSINYKVLKNRDLRKVKLIEINLKNN